MLERIARAIQRECIDGETIPAVDWNMQGYRYLSMARAAVEAMREPTPAMVAEGAEVMDPNSQMQRTCVVDSWKAMISAILAEEQKP